MSNDKEKTERIAEDFGDMVEHTDAAAGAAAEGDQEAAAFEMGRVAGEAENIAEELAREPVNAGGGPPNGGGLPPDGLGSSPDNPVFVRHPESITLGRTGRPWTNDQFLWTLIRNRTDAISFPVYSRFIDAVMCEERTFNAFGDRDGPLVDQVKQLRPFGTEAYDVLKAATEFFLMQEVGILDPGLTIDRTEAEQLMGAGSRRALQDALHVASLPSVADEDARLSEPFEPKTWQETLRRDYYERLAGTNMKVLPYFNIILDRLKDVAPKDEIATSCYGVLPSKVTGPLGLELIWSYWHEEGMLTQTFNAITVRFQNRRNGLRDPMVRLEIDPLRRLGNYIWGWIQSEPFRLSVRRRAYEYDHEYGLTLVGKAVGVIDSADRRSKFLEAFHHLLHSCTYFFQQDDDTTVIADAFPLLNALREVQILLAEGAHNQFGDLPWTARVEMLMQEWVLARPEMREFLGGRIMVPYKETWMDRVDAVKSMQGWTDVNVTHFRDLGVFGEQILLGIRYGSWATEIKPDAAANWARYWRPEIQGYLHAYRAATGVDLAARPDSTMPGVHLQRRLAALPRR